MKTDCQAFTNYGGGQCLALKVMQCKLAGAKPCPFYKRRDEESAKREQKLKEALEKGKQGGRPGC